METSEYPKEGFIPYSNGESANWIATYHHSIPNNAKDGVMLSMQYGINLDKLEEVIKDINASNFASNNTGREIELKFLKHSKATFLGPNSDGDTVLFNTYWQTDKWLIYEIFYEFELIMMKHGAKPHWGKLHKKPEIDYLKRTYKSWDIFESLRSELDPNDTFNIFTS